MVGRLNAKESSLRVQDVHDGALSEVVFRSFDPQAFFRFRNALLGHAHALAGRVHVKHGRLDLEPYLQFKLPKALLSCMQLGALLRDLRANTAPFKDRNVHRDADSAYVFEIIRGSCPDLRDSS